MRSVLAVMVDDENDSTASQALADKLAVPLFAATEVSKDSAFSLFLSYRDGCLKLLDKQLLKKGGLMVNIEPRRGEQHSWPAPKKSVFAQAIGKKTQSVVDATTGWAQDSLVLLRMGYKVTCIERSPVMIELIRDGFNRLSQKDWVQRRSIQAPDLMPGNAIEILNSLKFKPDCIYLDPMFPVKRKKSAKAKKSLIVLRDILGDDEDREALFAAAFAATGRRVVVKSPDYADPLGGEADEVFQGKLVRYDVYIKSGMED